MTDAIYPKAKEAFLSSEIDLINDDIRAILVDGDDYTYSDSHEFR